MKGIFELLKENLSKYSENYGEEIRNNKEKRSKFIQICNRIGIDPIVSKKSMWGRFSDFYNQLSVQILRICEKQREYNGGLMRVDDLIKIFNTIYPSNQITRDDVFKSVETLTKLGTGCKVINETYISTVPFELSQDQMLLMKFAEQPGFVSVHLAQQQGWSPERFDLCIVCRTNPETTRPGWPCMD
jgi:ESCRT-II complex subunit VPS22